MMTKEPDTTPIALTSEPPVVSRGGSKNAAVTEADTVMVTVIVVVMDARWRWT